MNPSQQFIVALAVVLVPSIASCVVAWFTLRQTHTNTQKLAENTELTTHTYTAVNSRLDQLMEALEAKYGVMVERARAEGMEAGRAERQAVWDAKEKPPR